MISRGTEADCRVKASRLLDSFLVGSPDEIDLETLAWHVGRLTIETGDLGTAEGQLIASALSGVIRIASHVQPEGRRRFTIAHEIGHYCLHGPKPTFDDTRDLTTWKTHSKETEANIFAGELLMPERLFKPRTISKTAPSLALIDALAKEFRTSSLAAGVHYIMYTREPCALVVSRGGEIEWMRRSTGFDYKLNMGKLSSCSAAGEIHAGKSSDTGGTVPVPAGAWLSGFEVKDRANICEDSRLVPGYNMIVTLLWADDVWED
jgi:hypothetical protein